jgi:hypothetical protein
MDKNFPTSILRGSQENPANPRRYWWASRESNTAPTDYESLSRSARSIQSSTYDSHGAQRKRFSQGVGQKIPHMLGIALTVISCAAQAGDFDVVVPIRSWHFDGADMGPQHWNENNLGLGLEYRQDGMFAGAVAYRDSYNKTAKAAYVGYTYSLPVAYGVSVEGTVRAGYIDGSGFHCWGALPSIGVSYGRTAVEVEFLPAIKKTQASVLALMVRQSF